MWETKTEEIFQIPEELVRITNHVNIIQLEEIYD